MYVAGFGFFKKYNSNALAAARDRTGEAQAKAKLRKKKKKTSITEAAASAFAAPIVSFLASREQVKKVKARPWNGEGGGGVRLKTNTGCVNGLL